MPYCDGLKPLKLGTQNNPPFLPGIVISKTQKYQRQHWVRQESAFSVHGAESVLNLMTTKRDYLDLRGFHYTIEIFFKKKNLQILETPVLRERWNRLERSTD